MKRTIVTLLSLLFIAASAANEIRSVRDIADALCDPAARDSTFEVSGTLTFRRNIRSLCTIRHEEASATVMLTGRAATIQATPGDTIRLKGRISRGTRFGSRIVSADEMEVIRRGMAPQPPLVSIKDVLGDRLENIHARIRATVQDVYTSDTNPRFCHLILKDGSSKVLATVPIPKAPNIDPNRLQEAQIEVCGICVRHDFSLRNQIGKVFLVSTWADIHITKPPPADPFDAPILTDLSGLSPETITSTDRRRIQGQVIAVLAKDRRMLLLAKNGFANVDIADGPLPTFGSEIEAVGFPTTDLFRINLNRARWRYATNAPPASPEPPVRITTRELFQINGIPGINTRMHGRAIRLKGIVRARPDDTSGERLAQIESDGILISVDANSVPEAQNDLSVGAVLDISGTCFVQTRNWSPNEDLPRAEGFILVVRTPSDITVISRAPWWTPRKILYAAIILLSAIVVTITWNFAVRRLAEKRGQELFKEHIARATAEMRVAERTRLAIELHDSLSQNLSGIALQMESVGRTMDNDPKRARDCLTTAVFLLRSCRDELRNCLYDLRIRALETNDLEDAVRLTVKPHLGESKLDIRFNIARERLSDTTAHAFLRIIRELVVNAVRHGNAGHIWIAGAFEQDGLSFSVRDDGCGFDPKNRPNVSTGHCGLAGIHERVRRLGGNIEIDSTPGRGTKVAVRIKELT